MTKKEQKEKTDGDQVAATSNEIEKLQQQIEELSKEKNDLFEKLQRVSADYANHQKRTPKQIADSVAYEKKAIIRSLLPGLDNFAHALAGAKTAEGKKALQGVIEGMRLVFDHMLDALKSNGVERVEAVGKEFDPSIHEAVMQRSEVDKPDNIVLEEYQNGYTLNGQVIRPSKVIVNKLPAKEPEPEKAEPEETLDVKENDIIEE